MTNQPPVILLVEDNQDHAELVKRCFERHNIANQIYHVTDGEAAINYIWKNGDYADTKSFPRPNVIFLDLRLPKIDGLEVLKMIKESEEYRKIPVVILTTSEADKDVAVAYEYYANSYLVKPFEFSIYTKMMDELGHYWLGYNINTKK